MEAVTEEGGGGNRLIKAGAKQDQGSYCCQNQRLEVNA